MLAKLGLRAAGIALATATAGVSGVIAASGANAWDPSVWDRVAYCESTWRWDVNTGNGYYGGLQFSHSTWAEFGGQVYGAEAHLATKAEQIAIARRVLYTQGPGAWPVCSVKAGLTKENGGADRNALPVETSSSPAPTASESAGATAPAAPTTTAKPTTSPTTTQPTAPQPTATATSYGTVSYRKVMLDVDGALGPLTVAEMQKWSGSYPDGIWGPKTSRALQSKVGADVTGVRDRQTTYAVQAYVGADEDGIWGRQTTSYLQRFLNNR